MRQMYKVFFNDRIVFFEDKFKSSFRDNTGLFYHYSDQKELKELVDVFFKMEKIGHLHLVHQDVNKLKKKFAACFTQIKAAGGLVRNHNGNFLIIKRNSIWDLPKGKNETGERIRTTALREVSEECGLEDIYIVKEIIKTYHTYILNNKYILKETVWYEMKTDDFMAPDPQTSEGISEIRWAKPGQIKFMLKNTYPSIIEVLKAARVL